LLNHDRPKEIVHFWEIGSSVRDSKASRDLEESTPLDGRTKEPRNRPDYGSQFRRDILHRTIVAAEFDSPNEQSSGR
jgi:hypothetical protein